MAFWKQVDESADTHMFYKFRAETERSLSDFMKGLEKLEADATEAEKAELSEHLKSLYNLDDLRNIHEYKISVNAAKGGLWGAVIAGGICFTASVLSPHLSGYVPIDVINKICMGSLLAEGLAALTAVLNESYITMFEKSAKSSMKNLVGEEGTSSEYNFNAGVSIVGDVYPNILRESNIYGIPV